MYSACKCLWSTIAFAALFAACAAAQTTSTGAISVTVNDQGGALVPGAQLTLKDIGTNDMRPAETQGNGNYLFPNLPFSAYQLMVTKTGFATQVIESVQVQTARVTSIDATLRVCGTTQTVTVAEAATPGVHHSGSPWGYRPMIYNPRWFNDDFWLNKGSPIHESMRLTLQAEFLNVFNHPRFAVTSSNIESLTFAQSTGQGTNTSPTGARNIEIRANFEF